MSVEGTLESVVHLIDSMRRMGSTTAAVRELCAAPNAALIVPTKDNVRQIIQVVREIAPEARAVRVAARIFTLAEVESGRLRGVTGGPLIFDPFTVRTLLRDAIGQIGAARCEIEVWRKLSAQMERTLDATILDRNELRDEVIERGRTIRAFERSIWGRAFNTIRTTEAWVRWILGR